MKLLKKMNETEKKNAAKSAEITFCFYSIILLIHSLYSYFVKGKFGASFTILILGLIVFFGSAFILNKIKKG